MNRREYIKALACTAVTLPAIAHARPGPTLRARSNNTLPVGVALRANPSKAYTARELDLIHQHFDIITPENTMKWPNCQPTPGPHHFEKSDVLVDFAEKNQQKIVGHTLLFNRKNEYPAWIFSAGTGKASRALVESRLKQHIQAMMGHYKGRTYAWDVVNEAVEKKEPYYRETDWYHMFKGEFVPLAFRLAKEADPKALLIYNDFQVENPQKRERVLILLEELKREGLLPDVVGIQGHWELDDVPFDELEKTILALHQFGVRTSVTELDIDVISRKHYWNPKMRPEVIKQDPYRDGCPDDVLARQAEQYGQLFRLFMKHADKMERVTFWGLTDRHSWLNSWPWKRTNHGLLFDRQARPKPAFYAVADALNRP